MNCFHSCHRSPSPSQSPIPECNLMSLSKMQMQIHLPATGLASFGRGVARRIRVNVNVKPPINDVERDLQRTRNISSKTVFPTFPAMQDPDHAVGDEHFNNFADLTSPTTAPAPYEASASLPAATAPPAASGIDDPTKKAVDNVLYSDVRIGSPMRQTHANHWI